jgi:hypothetical protein
VPWILVDLAVAVLSIAVLGIVALSLYRHSRALTRTIGGSATTLAEATADLNRLQTEGATRR